MHLQGRKQGLKELEAEIVSLVTSTLRFLLTLIYILGQSILSLCIATYQPFFMAQKKNREMLHISNFQSPALSSHHLFGTYLIASYVSTVK